MFVPGKRKMFTIVPALHGFAGAESCYEQAKALSMEIYEPLQKCLDASDAAKGQTCVKGGACTTRANDCSTTIMKDVNKKVSYFTLNGMKQSIIEIRLSRKEMWQNGIHFFNNSDVTARPTTNIFKLSNSFHLSGAYEHRLKAFKFVNTWPRAYQSTTMCS